MKFIKYFKEILESIINLTNVKNWFVKFNHSKKHDLDIKMSNRTELSDKKFEEILDKIIKICDDENIDGDYVFISLKYKAKIITRVIQNKKTLYIITFLGKDESMKNTKNIRII